MIAIGKLISTTVVKTKRIVKAIVFGKNDVREANECMPFGVDGNPIAGMSAIYASTTLNSAPVILGYINAGQLAAAGEIRTYATDSDGAVQCSLWHKATGVNVFTGTSIELLGNANHATQWEALNTQLQDYLTNPATGLYYQINAGIVAAGGTFTPPTPLDITTAKLTKIKTE